MVSQVWAPIFKTVPFEIRRALAESLLTAWTYRVVPERIIRDFASVLKNKCDIAWYEVADCELVNDKVDR